MGFCGITVNNFRRKTCVVTVVGDEKAIWSVVTRACKFAVSRPNIFTQKYCLIFYSGSLSSDFNTNLDVTRTGFEAVFHAVPSLKPRKQRSLPKLFRRQHG